MNTSILVKRFEAQALQIASLKRQNHELKENIRCNEIKAMKLIDHYKCDIEAQTNLVAKLRDELRANEELEFMKRRRNFRDQGTWIEEEELQSAEKELIAIIHILEDEIQTQKEVNTQSTQEFKRKTLVNEAKVKQSRLKDIEAFRSQISSSVYMEVSDAIEQTHEDNKLLRNEFRVLLLQMHKLQESRDSHGKELSRIKREYDLLLQENHLAAAQKRYCEEQQKRMDEETIKSTTSCEHDLLAAVTSRNRQKDATGSSLEDYFKQAMHQQEKSIQHQRYS